MGLILPVHHTVKRLPPLARMTKAELLLLVLLSAELGLRSQARLFLMPFLLYTAVLYPLTLIYTFLFFHLLTALCYFSLTEQSGILEILGSRFSFLRSLWAPWSRVCNECISDLQKECGSENRMNAGLPAQLTCPSPVRCGFLGCSPSRFSGQQPRAALYF